jgi:hypothetical protein
LDGVADAAIVAASVTGRDDEQAVLDVEKRVAHNYKNLKVNFIFDLRKKINIQAAKIQKKSQPESRDFDPEEKRNFNEIFVWSSHKI